MLKKILCCLFALIVVLGMFSGCDQTPTPTEPSGDPPKAADHYKTMAVKAVDDMIKNFWNGDSKTGHIYVCSHGFPTESQDPLGACPWETSMIYGGIYDMYFLTKDQKYKDLVLAEANFYRNNFNADTMDFASGNYNWAADDCAWNAIMYLSFYKLTEDSWFLDRAVNLLDSVMERWYNPDQDIGDYKDGVDYMSYYEAGICLSWLQIWELTDQQRFYDLALASYNRIQSKLGRDDGLYWAEANAWFASGNKDQIGEGGSASALAGNMCMAALSAKFYKITGEQVYLDRVYKTNEGLLKYYDNDGVLLNDRDAWTNATFAAYYVSEVLSLPNTDEMKELIFNTADSIYNNARTADGYYGGSWSGPAEGPQSIWYVKESTPQQCMTTGTSVMMITAAALLEAQVNDYVR